MVSKCDENSHESWKALIEKYGVSYEKQGILNEVTKSWNNFRINHTSQDSNIWFNGLFNLNLKLIKFKEKYEKDEDNMRAHVFDVSPEY